MRSLRERIVHTALFEILALVIVTPTVSALTGAPVIASGLLSVLISAGAVVANYLWTWMFDRWVPTRRRGPLLRLGQAIGLELLLFVYTVPLVLLLTDLGLAQAVLLDLAGVFFFVLFGAAYNAAFDAAMVRLAPEASPRRS
jgi:uncharacterized membrane protein